MAKVLRAADLDDSSPRTVLLGVVISQVSTQLVFLHVYISLAGVIEGLVYRTSANPPTLTEAFDETTVRDSADYLCIRENLRLISACCDGTVCHHLLARGAELLLDGRLRRPREGTFAGLTLADFPQKQLVAARRQFASRYANTDH